jgi:hypothetical protein
MASLQGRDRFRLSAINPFSAEPVLQITPFITCSNMDALMQLPAPGRSNYRQDSHLGGRLQEWVENKSSVNFHGFD